MSRRVDGDEEGRWEAENRGKHRGKIWGNRQEGRGIADLFILAL